MTEQPASTRDLEHTIKAATSLIRAAWPLLLDPTSSATGAGAASTDPVTALDKRVSLAAEITRDLAHWADQIRARRPITRALPRAGDTHGLLDFIDRHADWLTGQHDGPACAAQLTDRARELRNLTIPRRRTHVHLGTCPLQTWNTDLEQAETCAGRVRARIGSADGTATCERCGTTRTIAWWQWELGLSTPPLTGEAMARVLRQRMGVTVTGQTVRNWAKTGQVDAYVEPFGPAPQWPRFDQEVVLLQVAQMGRACAMCGQAWHGAGDLCTRCYVQAHSRRPARAVPKRATPVRGGRPATRPDPNVRLLPGELDEAGNRVRLPWCDMGDMPAAWCGCGRHHELGA